MNLFNRILVVLGLLIPGITVGQVTKDSIAFHSYLCGENIGTAINLSNIISGYKQLSEYKRSNCSVPTAAGDNSIMGTTIIYNDDRLTHLTEGVRYADITFMGVDGGYDVSETFREDVYNSFCRYWEGKTLANEKARLVENLRKFDAVSSNKPIFFSTIYSKYKGNIKKYVDALYSKSIMGNPDKLTDFLSAPTAKKLQKDLGVQFAIGLALYDLWIKQTKAEMAATNE